MDHKNPASDKGTEQINSSAGENPGEQSQKQSKTTCPYQQDADEKFDKQVKALRVWWASQELTKRVEIVIGGAGLFVVATYTLISLLQWHEIRYANTLTTNATQAATRTQILLNLPLLVPVNARLNWDNSPDDPPAVYVREDYQNLGETRAVRPVASMGWGFKIPDSHTRYQAQSDDWFRLTWTKGQPRVQTATMPLEEARKLAGEVEAKQPLYFYTKIRYNDVFPIDDKAGHSRNDHLIESCIQITHMHTGENDKPRKGVSTEWGGLTCGGRSNCVDDECSDY